MTDPKTLTHSSPLREVLGNMAETFDEALDIEWGDDDEVLVCGVENPDVCECCQERLGGDSRLGRRVRYVGPVARPGDAVAGVPAGLSQTSTARVQRLGCPDGTPLWPVRQMGPFAEVLEGERLHEVDRLCRVVGQVPLGRSDRRVTQHLLNLVERYASGVEHPGEATAQVVRP